MGDNKKVANSVVALSSAAVLAIYGAGYARTRAAADRFAQQAAERRPHIPATRESPALQVDPPAPTKVEVPSPSPVVDRAETRADVKVAPVTPKPAVAAPIPKAEPKPDHAAVASAGAAPVTATEEGTVDTTQAATPSVVPPAAPPVVPTPAPEPARAGYKDGTYYGWGTSRHGDIQAAVVIEEGRITVARVERCLTRYSCNWITPIPPRILSKQGTTYDYVSGATESSDAFQDAVAEALSQAK